VILVVKRFFWGGGGLACVFAVTGALTASLTQVGVQMMNWFSVACELHYDWCNDIEGWATCCPNAILTTAT
jgi:hypothetical protein